MADAALRVGIVTVSDRASRGEYDDLSGPAVQAALATLLVSDWMPVVECVPDDRGRIEQVLVRLADDEQCHLVLTTGGTGPAPRDVTPEATAAVCDRLLPGFGEAMRAASLERVPTAMLSRQTAGRRGTCLMVNLPGKPTAAAECLAVVMPAIAHFVALLGGPRVDLSQPTIAPHD